MSINELIFHEVCTIKHKDNLYALFIGPNCCKYFFRVENNEYKEVKYDEYIELMEKYGSFTNKMDQNIFGKDAKIIFNNKLMPIALALSMILSLSACSTSRDRVIRNYKDMGIILDDGEFKNDNIYKVSALNGGDYPYEKVVTPKEFTINEGYEDITWDDILAALKENKNITAIQTMYFEPTIENLKASGLDLDLGVLYYNVKNFKGFTSDKDATPDNLLAVASFNHYNNTINLNGVKTENYGDTIIHEMIGHGLVHGYNKDTKTLCTCDYGYYSITEDGKIVGGGCLGKALDEGFADTIRGIATGKTLSPDNCTYMIESFVFNLLLDVSNTTLEAYQKGGIEVLLHNLKVAEITKPQELVGYFDTIREALNKNELSGLNTNLANVLYEGLFKDLIDKYKTEGLPNEEIERKVLTYIENANKKVIPEVYKDEHLYIATTFDGIVTLNTTTLEAFCKEYINSLSR